MECFHCKGDLKRGVAPLRIDRKGWHVTIDEVPAWVCDQCGEHLFDVKEMDTVQDLIKTVEQQNTLFKQSA